MKRIAVLLITCSLVLISVTGCKEVAREQQQEDIIQPVEVFNLIPGQDWQKVAIFEGQIGGKTTSFTIPDRYWKISWEATIPKREVGTFSVEIYREDGTLLDEVYAEIPSGATQQGKYSESTWFYEGKSSFYLITGTRNISFWKTTIETLSAVEIRPSEVVRAFYQALNENDLEGAMEYLPAGKNLLTDKNVIIALDQLVGKIKQVEIQEETINKTTGAECAEARVNADIDLTPETTIDPMLWKLIQGLEGTQIFELEFSVIEQDGIGWKIINWP